nr:MAG TPA: hypothetical protein [Caudoviricetes sp.]
MSGQMVDRLDVIEAGLRAEVAEIEESIEAADLLLAEASRVCPPATLDSTVACLRRFRGELGSCKLRAVTALGRLAHSRVCATRMECEG